MTQVPQTPMLDQIGKELDLAHTCTNSTSYFQRVFTRIMSLLSQIPLVQQWDRQLIDMSLHEAELIKAASEEMADAVGEIEQKGAEPIKDALRDMLEEVRRPGDLRELSPCIYHSRTVRILLSRVRGWPIGIGPFPGFSLVVWNDPEWIQGRRDTDPSYIWKDLIWLKRRWDQRHSGLSFFTPVPALLSIIASGPTLWHLAEQHHHDRLEICVESHFANGTTESTKAPELLRRVTVDRLLHRLMLELRSAQSCGAAVPDADSNEDRQKKSTKPKEKADAKQVQVEMESRWRHDPSMSQVSLVRTLFENQSQLRLLRPYESERTFEEWAKKVKAKLGKEGIFVGQGRKGKAG